MNFGTVSACRLMVSPVLDVFVLISVWLLHRFQNYFLSCSAWSRQRRNCHRKPHDLLYRGWAHWPDGGTGRQVGAECGTIVKSSSDIAIKASLGRSAYI